MTDLSILIPARNEIYLAKTIENVLENIRGNTEIIAVIDGFTIPVPDIPKDLRVKIIEHSRPMGQRQSINEAARVSEAKFIMKLDAHSAVDEGFDVKLMADCEYNWTVIPRMYNLDHETWKPKFIENEREAIRKGKLHDYMYIGFNEKNELRTLYYTGIENKKIHKRKELIDDTMSCMGPCFFMHRDRFWELGGCDENHGGWGQQGIEVSLKAWLSGGCLKVNKKTWFAHWFRGGGGPGFPYHITGKDVDKARNYSMDLWLNNKWPLQVRDFEWVVDKFKPKNWEGKDVRFRGKTESKKNIYKENKAAESAGQPTEKKENKNKKENKEITIIYYTDNTLEPEFEKRVQQELIKAAEGKRIISVSQKPIDFGDNICVGDIGRSHHSMFYQILIGAQEAKTKYIALAEHDCMYTAEHFNFIPPKEDVFYYNSNHWFAEWNTKKEGLYSHFESDRKALSQIICAKDIFIEAIKEKISMIEAGYEIQRGVAGACEPGVAPNNKAFKGAPESAQKWKSEEFETIIPNLDIRSRKNFSGIRRGRIRQYCLPYWGSFHKVMNKIPPGKWYQEATINGAVMPTRRSNDTNQRRWQNFIKPLLPFKGEGRTFIELGCNAGFYCRKMSDRGFKAIGIEKEPIFIRHAHYWQSCEPKNVKIIEGDINDYNIPTAQIVLMANVHYWLTKEQLNKLVKKLRQRALYVLVVDRYKPVKEHKSLCGFETLKKTFKGWEIVKQAMPEGKKHYSVLFKNPSLIEKDTSELFHHQQLAKSKRFLPAYSELVRDILDGKEMDYKKTKYWDYLIWRRFKEKDMLLNRHVKLVQSILDNGFIEPLTIGRVMGFEFKENRLVDGDHRYIIARELGIKKLICKKLGA